MNLTDTNYDWKNYIDWIFDTRRGKILQPQKWTFWEKDLKKLKSITMLHFMTTFHNVALKIETSFKLQRSLNSLWKLKKSMINIKPNETCLRCNKQPPLQIKYHNRWKYLLRPEKNGFVVQNPFFLFFAKQHFIFFCYKTWPLWS